MKYLPPLILKGAGKSKQLKLEAAIFNEWSSAKGMSKVEAQHEFLSILKSDFEFYYGSFFFTATVPILFSDCAETKQGVLLLTLQLTLCSSMGLARRTAQ